MNSNKTTGLILIFLLIAVGLTLLWIGKFSAANFLIYLPIVSLVSLAFYLADKLKLLKVGNNELQMFEKARDDIKEYLSEIYSIHLAGIVSKEVLSVEFNTKAIDFDHFMEIYDKTSKYGFNVRLNDALNKALEAVLKRQGFLIMFYSQHQVDENKSAEEIIDECTNSAKFEVMSERLELKDDLLKHQTNSSESLESVVRKMFTESVKNTRKLLKVQEELKG